MEIIQFTVLALSGNKLYLPDTSLPPNTSQLSVQQGDFLIAHLIDPILYIMHFSTFIVF